ncbi:hypothetical protein C8R47DRAFT_1075176 [Mycena vitilis]|nr:hypothetical protein C8R47DRAFT_1075176 [Mycena vitilis]
MPPTSRPAKRRIEDSSDEDEVTAVSDKENLDDMTFTQLKEAYRNAQLEKNEAEKRARRALGDITNDDNSGNAAKRRKKAKKHAKKKHTKRRRLEAQSEDDTDSRDTSDSSESEDDDTDRAKEVASFGRHCVIERALWIESDTFETAIDAAYDEKTRFDGGKAQGQLRDILAVIPGRYRGKEMRAGWFKHALYVALIRGSTAAAQMLKPEDDAPLPQTDTMERIHHIEHAIAGAIAASCTLTIWGKSEDAHLKKRGVTTNIDYAARFEEYLEILTTGLRTKVPSILHVFSEWDRIVFPNAEVSAVDPASRAGKSDGFKRAMEAMRAEEPVDDGGEPQDAEDEQPCGP